MVWLDMVILKWGSIMGDKSDFIWDNINTITGSEHRISEWEEQHKREIRKARKDLSHPKCGANKKDKVEAKQKWLSRERKRLKVRK